MPRDGDADNGGDYQPGQGDNNGPEQHRRVLANRDYLMLMRQKVFVDRIGDGIGSRHEPHNDS